MPEGSKTKKSRLASFKELDEESKFLKLPDIEGAEYIVALLMEAGLCQSNGMGVIPLSWNEIESWHKFLKLDLPIWERLLIRTLSEEYTAELSKASAKDAAAPYISEVDRRELDRAAVANKIRSVFAGFKRTPKPE